jgi:hypothetical protein
MMPTAAAARIAIGVAVLAILVYAYVVAGSANGFSPFDYFGFFTNLTSLLTSVILILTGALELTRRRVPEALHSSRAVATACLLIVGVVYNVLVPGTGSAPPWVSASLHVVFPILVLLDWIVVGDRPTLPWRRLWIVLPYPLTWLVIVLIRGATDGWVPYGFLLPERGMLSLVLHILGLLVALLLAGAVVWATSRLRLTRLRPDRR